jgi:hypothetical protein
MHEPIPFPHQPSNKLQKETMSDIEMIISENPSSLDTLTPEHSIRFHRFLEHYQATHPKESAVRQYPIDEVLPEYQCPACHDIGYVRVEKGVGSKTEPCEGIQQKGCPIYQKNGFISVKKFSVPPAEIEYL